MDFGLPFIHKAAPVLAEITRNDVNVTGADVNKIGPGGSSPLAEASRIGSARMVEFLVDEGADLELKNPAYCGATAVVVAVMNRRQTVVDVLIAVSVLSSLLIHINGHFS